MTTRTVINQGDDTGTETEQARLEAEAAAKAAALTAIDEAAEAARNAANADFARIMKQAERMASPDLRDQAYLSAVEFAIANSDLIGADTAMEMLSQPQLRDTARAKIAVKYAQLGQTDAAFELIDTVEIDDLRDFMRLQVIEAITRKE